MGVKNLILIIGNGFDLAHGLKTSFADFANFYINNKIVPELKSMIVNHYRNPSFFKAGFIEQMLSKTTTTAKNDYKDQIWRHIAFQKEDLASEFLIKNPAVIKNFLMNSFLGKLYANEYINWFDIENAYFSELISIKKENLNKQRNLLLGLNNEFLEIKNELKTYLETIEITPDPKISNFFTRNISDAENVYILNFNYTDAIDNYVRKRKDQTTTVNYIHGSLLEENIIFGYGNDQNTEYQEIKSLEINEFLEFFKTFEYLNYSNYSRIYSEALDAFDEYEVLVLGHSLGSTDKTLLDEIINTDKCKKVHLFKRGDLKENPEEVLKAYRQLTFSASRILSDEKDLRKKIVDFPQSTFFP